MAQTGDKEKFSGGAPELMNSQIGLKLRWRQRKPSTRHPEVRTAINAFARVFGMQWAVSLEGWAAVALRGLP